MVLSFLTGIITSDGVGAPPIEQCNDIISDKMEAAKKVETL